MALSRDRMRGEKGGEGGLWTPHSVEKTETGSGDQPLILPPLSMHNVHNVQRTIYLILKQDEDFTFLNRFTGLFSIQDYNQQCNRVL